MLISQRLKIATKIADEYNIQRGSVVADIEEPVTEGGDAKKKKDSSETTNIIQSLRDEHEEKLLRGYGVILNTAHAVRTPSFETTYVVRCAQQAGRRRGPRGGGGGRGYGGVQGGQRGHHHAPRPGGVG
jgi:hypothetical protein